MNHKNFQESKFRNSRDSQNSKKSLVKYQFQIETSEKEIWQQYADNNHRGNLARMIRTIVNQTILGHELGEEDKLSKQLDGAIKSIQENSDKTVYKVGSLEDDLMIIKSLLSKLLQTQSHFVSEYQTTNSLPLEDLVYQQVFDFVANKERRVTVEEILPYLADTSDECKRFIAKEDQKLPAGGKIAISFILEEVLKVLYNETKNPVYNLNAKNKHDFGRSLYDF